MPQSLGKIVILDPEAHIRELLCYNLRAEGYEAEAYLEPGLVGSLDFRDTRLVIIDAFSSPSGLDALRELTTSVATAHVGVIVCSAGESAGEAITALDAGADDYIAKPFSLREMIARVRAVMRRRRPVASALSAATASFGPLSVNFTTRTATLHGTPMKLTPTEYAILAMLMKNRDRHLTRIEIYRSVWNTPEAGTNERVVDTNISRLRRKLGELGPSLQNHSGSGYILSEK